VKYKIIWLRHGDPGDIEREVNRSIEQGWKPQGGLCMTFQDIHSYVMQAMVKEDEEEER